MTSIETLDYVGVALFAATGALAASRKQLDIIGFLFLAAVSNQTPDRNHFETGRVSIYNERTSIFRGVRLLFPLFSKLFQLSQEPKAHHRDEQHHCKAKNISGKNSARGPHVCYIQSVVQGRIHHCTKRTCENQTFPID